MISEEEIEFYKSILPELNIVFDVGCQHDNIFDELKPGIEVHLFDPVKSEQLLEKIKDKGNVHYNNIALGNYQGESIFHKGYGSILLREELGPDDDHSESFIPIDTIWNYCYDKWITDIDFLKIDTEGFDFEVIKGCAELLPCGIKYIQFEHWDDQLAKEIIDFLRPRELTELLSKPKNYIVKL